MLAASLASSGGSVSAIGAAGLILDISGGLMIAFGLMAKRPEQWIDELSPRYGFNAVQEIGAALQTADAQVGAAFLALGFTGQLASDLGWHLDSARDVIAASIAAGLADLAGWVFLTRVWRRRKIQDMAMARLESLGADGWWPAIATYGKAIGLQSDGGVTETIAAFAERVLGPRRWRTFERDRALPDIYTKLRRDIPGTEEYDERIRAEQGDPAPPDETG